MSHLVYQCASFFIRAFYQTKYSSRLLIDPELMVSHAVFILNRPVGDMGCFDILNRNIFNLVEIHKEWHMYNGFIRVNEVNIFIQSRDFFLFMKTGPENLRSIAWLVWREPMCGKQNLPRLSVAMRFTNAESTRRSSTVTDGRFCVWSDTLPWIFA
jgi:hypothetical protein